MNKPRILITGGASGLGRALAEQYLKRGARILITDINEEGGADTVKALKNLGEIHFQKADSCSDEDWASLVDWCEDHFGGLDILVNNAGVAGLGRIDHVTMDDWDWIIEVNMKSVVRGCRTFVPMLKRQGDGQIINIASLAGVVCGPASASYNVTKAGVIALSETLRHELPPYGIKVSVACPSFFQTNLAESLRSPEEGADKLIRKLLASGKLSADQVADYIISRANRDQFLILPHSEARQMWFFKRFVPPMFRRIMGGLGYSMKKEMDRNP